MLTYQKALETLNNRPQKKIANNTILRLLNENSIEIVHFTTPIITIYKNDTYKIKTNGYRTFTTKRRINFYSPIFIRQMNHTWYAFTPKGQIVFEDDMIFDYCGNLIKDKKE